MGVDRAFMRSDPRVGSQEGANGAEAKLLPLFPSLPFGIVTGEDAVGSDYNCFQRVAKGRYRLFVEAMHLTENRRVKSIVYVGHCRSEDAASRSNLDPFAGNIIHQRYGRPISRQKPVQGW